MPTEVKSRPRNVVSPVPATKRMAALRKRRKAAGLARLEVWAHPDDHQAIRATASRMACKNNQPTKFNMNKTIEQTLYSLDAMAEDAEEDGNTDRARLLRTCGTLLRVEIVRLTDRVEHLRGGLKWCIGRLLDANDMEAADMALEMAGDMEPTFSLRNASDACIAQRSSRSAG